MLAAIADGPSRLVRPLRARDTDLMAAGLRALGVRIEDDGADWLVTPGALRGPADGGRRAGRHRAALPAAGRRAGHGPVRRGRRPAAARPAQRRAARGAARTSASGSTTAAAAGRPFTVHGTGRVRGGAVAVDASESSQIVSGLLLAAARFDDGHRPVAGRRRAVDAARRDDRDDAARARRRGHRHRPRLAGLARADRRPRRGRRARPLQRRAVPRRRAGHRRTGHRARLAGGHHPARRPAGPAARRDGRRGRPAPPTGLRVTGTGAIRRWSPTWARSAS